jgi:FKBP12-rapamycin complex-associated protein
MLIKALEVSGIEGTYRIICIQIMELLRKKRDSLLAILGSFVDDPLISFRLMIPMIIRKRKMLGQIKMTEMKRDSGIQKKNEIENKNIKKNNINKEENIFDSKLDNHDTFESHSMKENSERVLKKMKQLLVGDEDNNNKNILKIEDKKVVEYNGNEEKEKIEKKKMEDNERLLFNLFEENDEIQSEELNKIAEMVLNRIKDKLSGTDIYPDLVYDAQTQVDKLITQATSFENLAQSYLGWCPFW